ncbi:MAG: glycosyltransferase family 2 protein [Bacilli bacterium]
MKNLIVLIPTLNPTRKLLEVIENLEKNKLTDIVIVNDGSDIEHKKIFKEINHTILTHRKNSGKGKALKTGFAYIEENYKDYRGILTIDDDGQHDIESILKLVDSFVPTENYTIIGTRDFDKKGVPILRKKANKLSAYIFKKLYKVYIPDTQTGLRIYSKKAVDLIKNLKSDGFEFELEALIYLIKHQMDFQFEFINTIYNKEKGMSHFKPLKDSIRIYKIMFSNKK